VHPRPAHALTDEEREAILEIANEQRFAETPPARIVPMLADEGSYIASESSFHRVLRAAGQSGCRGRAKTPRKIEAADHSRCHGPEPGLVLGHDVLANSNCWSLVLSVSHPGPLQHEDRLMGGSCHRQLRTCRALGTSHFLGGGYSLPGG